MSTRSKRDWKLDSQGQYPRQIGWRLTRSGQRGQHKFRLGDDLEEARRREERLEDLWRTVSALSDAKLPVWSEEALEIALQVARGALSAKLALRPSEEPQPYAERVLLAQQTYKAVPIFAADDREFNIGFWQLQFEARQLFGSEKAYHKLVPRTEPRFEMHIRPYSEFDLARADADAVPPPPTSLGPKLHEALEDYITWIKQEYHRPALGRITDNAHTRIKQVRTLIDRHPNVCVSELDFEAVERMFSFWRRRPLKKGKKDRFVSLSCANKQLDELKRFFGWLHRSSKYDWRRPDEFEAIKKRAEPLATDHDGGLQQVDTFSLKELVLLYQFASPIERALILLALNCGFGVAEIASVLRREVFLFRAHEPRHQEVLHFATTDNDSFIKRIRRKNRVYGEFILFPQTVAAVQWLSARRRKQSPAVPNDLLILNERAQPFDQPTKSGNRNQQIPNHFNALIKRIEGHEHTISNLSFGKLRKTAGDLIRRFSDGETMRVFLCHDKPVQSDNLSDVYSNRPFGRVFQAIRKVEEFLQPMFAALEKDRLFDDQ